MKRFRHVSLYYRDENKVFRKVPGIKLLVNKLNGRLVEVYTLPTAAESESERIELY
jgi:hypothetical protein